MSFRAFEGRLPQVHPSCFADESAQLIGDVELAEDASVWFNCVLRGDVAPIRIGRRSNIQDLSLIHATRDRSRTDIGEDVTVGHHVVLHGCRVRDRVLVGMGAILLDGVDVGEDCMVGAGTLLTPGTRIEPGHLVLGSPGRIKRPLTPAERDFLRASADSYVQQARKYRSR